jgi:oxygen-independent coproporphyrinogen-3 oxidase
MIYNFLNEHGYTRYEVSNFSRDGKSSKHNLTYWRNQEYYGVGLGASGYLNSIRYTNTKSMKRYLLKAFKDQEEVIDASMKEFEYLMLNLRLQQGFLLDEFLTLFHRPFSVVYESIIPTLIEKKLLEITSDRAFLSFEGMMLLDYVVVKLGQHRLPNLAL